PIVCLQPPDGVLVTAGPVVGDAQRLVVPPPAQPLTARSASSTAAAAQAGEEPAQDGLAHVRRVVGALGGGTASAAGRRHCLRLSAPAWRPTPAPSRPNSPSAPASRPG